MPDNAFQLNIEAVRDLIGSETNKVSNNGSNNLEGAMGERIDELDLSMSDEELLRLRNKYEATYAPYEIKIKEIARANLKSYLGKEGSESVLSSDETLAANLQFESEETFLPAATSQDPSPFVYCDNTPEGNKIAKSIQTMLEFHADQLLLRRKLAIMVRQWSIYHLGVLKMGWKKFNEEDGDVDVDNRKIQDFIFDPNGYVNVYGEFTSWMGERISLAAEKLVDIFPEHKDEITLEVEEKMGTEVVYTEWWNDDYCFSTFKNIVLDKHKNEYFNYPKQTKEVDINGMLVKIPARNHFATPKKPYVFLSVFSLQNRPHDITGLIEQNIPNQRKISKRTSQIDTNLSQSNNGIAFSENNFNQETAKQASNALINGVGKVLVPSGGPIGEAIVRINAPSVPNSFFEELEITKNDLRTSWGTQGITSQAPKPDQIARSMLMNENRDNSRIGGGIGDVLEQSVARSVFNWFAQLYMVFYDKKHFGAVLGSGKAVEYTEIQANDIDRQLIVGVTSNSMKPKDEVSKINQATSLFQLKAIGPKTLLEALDFPNPDEAASDGVLWNIAPAQYMELNFPEMWAKLQQLLAQQQQSQQQANPQQEAQRQQMQMKQQEHQQKLQHNQEIHQQKMQQNQQNMAAKMVNTAPPINPSIA